MNRWKFCFQKSVALVLCKLLAGQSTAPSQPRSSYDIIHQQSGLLSPGRATPKVIEPTSDKADAKKWLRELGNGHGRHSIMLGKRNSFKDMFPTSRSGGGSGGSGGSSYDHATHSAVAVALSRSPTGRSSLLERRMAELSLPDAPNTAKLTPVAPLTVASPSPRSAKRGYAASSMPIMSNFEKGYGSADYSNNSFNRPMGDGAAAAMLSPTFLPYSKQSAGTLSPAPDSRSIPAGRGVPIPISHFAANGLGLVDPSGPIGNVAESFNDLNENILHCVEIENHIHENYPSHDTDDNESSTAGGEEDGYDPLSSHCDR